MVTKIQDRFGNQVDDTYADGQLDKIIASDGRTITIAYELVDAVRRPTGATAHGRTWTYSYRAGSLGSLASVTLPDGRSKWEYENLGVVAFKPNGIGGYRSEERRGGTEGVSTCRSRWAPYH